MRLAICDLYLELAGQHLIRGEAETSTRLLRANHRLIGEGADRRLRDPVLCYILAVTAEGLGDPEAAREAMEEAAQGIGEALPGETSRGLVSRWFFYRFRGLLELGGPDAPRVGSVEEAIAAIEADAARLGLDDAETIYCADLAFSRIATGQRAMGQLEAAERTAARMLDVARGLVERWPERAACASFLANAYQQTAKNAWQYQDVPAVDRWLRRSIEACRRAVALAPNHERYRFELADREGRLAELPPH